MTKADKNEVKLMLIQALDTKLDPVIKMLNSHNQTLCDETTGLVKKAVRHNDRIDNLEKFQTEVKAKMGIIGAIFGAIGSGVILFFKWLLSRNG